ncbi:hypothetical protein Tco_1029979 [Tanacetum coccineum]|uniref:Retrotransposon gag domain-containing protein n=1 Tax=Tanacetum coccineum TaxID=301880 RepID=A0ABQ5G4Z0_9ASTR
MDTPTDNGTRGSSAQPFPRCQTLGGSARGWFERLPANSINELAELREVFSARYSVRRACFKEPHEITKIVRKYNESLTTFKERWIVETGFIMGVPEVMKIASFMDSLKCPELEKRYSDKVPQTVEEMMLRLDDFVCSEEAFAWMELPKGEVSEHPRRSFLPVVRRDDRPYQNNQGGSLEGMMSRENGHHTIDCIQLRKQLEMALESGKLNHLVCKGKENEGPGGNGGLDEFPDNFSAGIDRRYLR